MILGTNSPLSLGELLAGIEGVSVYPRSDIRIAYLATHSQEVCPGTLFVAHKKEHIKTALSKGAVAVALAQSDPSLDGVVQIVHSDLATLESIVAQRLYPFPRERLRLIGITGTNGKTTSAYLVQHVLGDACGLIGTVECKIRNQTILSDRTTPDLVTCQKMLYRMYQAECTHAVMEVSSHGLDQGRVRGLQFEVGVFTNLTQDHLDYHKSMEGYAKAKAKLFAVSNTFVVNADSPWTPVLLKGLQIEGVSYGIRSKADLQACDLQFSMEGVRGFLAYKGRRVPFFTRLIGEFNVYNYMAAIGTALLAGIALEEAVNILSTFSPVGGRLERVENKRGKHIFVDYAHTDDALYNVLKTMKMFAQGRVFCVFGCGGDRDRTKRPKMGAVARSLADAIWITSDNPRGENPEKIVEEILAGIVDRSNVFVEIDRQTAIESAIEQLGEKDVLLIAGKGHESYQIFADKTIHFDDRIIAKAYCD